MTTHEQLTQASNEELIEHILTRYHDTHREQLPELIHLAERVELERITDGLTLPDGACGSWQRLYQGLSTFRDDLEAHIRIENDLLFSRVDDGNCRGQVSGGWGDSAAEHRGASAGGG